MLSRRFGFIERSVHVRITIDSSDALDDALRVVGALYGVTISADEAASVDGASAEPAGRPEIVAPSPAPSRGKARRSRVSGSKRSSMSDMAVVRSWAREHGHRVSDRGRVSKAVLDAYRSDAATS